LIANVADRVKWCRPHTQIGAAARVVALKQTIIWWLRFAYIAILRLTKAQIWTRMSANIGGIKRIKERWTH
jgi:hypothetical protein